MNKMKWGNGFLRRHRHLTKWLAYCLIILGVAGIALAVILWHRQAIPKLPADTSQNIPSARKPNQQEVSSYTVPADHPRYITIPSIGVPQTRVLPLGLTRNNQIAVPDNIYDAGWYTGSAKPGQSGAMFIYGHVSSWQADGVFYNLKKLRPGDSVTITSGDNKTYTYKVVSLKVYPYNAVNMNQVLAPIDPSKPGLNLMTCTGQVIKGTSEFNERLVVFTKLEN